MPVVEWPLLEMMNEINLYHRPHPLPSPTREELKRLIELKDIIHEKLHPKNKPHLHADELHLLWNEACELLRNDVIMACGVLDLTTMDVFHSHFRLSFQ